MQIGHKGSSLKKKKIYKLKILNLNDTSTEKIITSMKIPHVKKLFFALMKCYKIHIPAIDIIRQIWRAFLII